MPGTTNLYGEPLLTRKSDIANKVAVSQTLYPIELMGRLQSLKQIRVRITLPVYRLENGRTRTFQKEYLATHPDAPRDLFTLDPESIEAQKAQHEILQMRTFLRNSQAVQCKLNPLSSRARAWSLMAIVAYVLGEASIMVLRILTVILNTSKWQFFRKTVTKRKSGHLKNACKFRKRIALNTSGTLVLP